RSMHNVFMESPHPLSTSLPALMLRWLRDSVRRRGAWGSIKSFAEQFGLFIRDSLPDRRRSRFGDIDYDCDFGVDTTWARLPMSVRLRELFTERLYQPTDPVEFHDVLKQVPADFSQFAFIDLGSGKGRALLLAAEYPFREIVGIEVQPELSRIAQQNIIRFPSDGRLCRSISSLCMDAREFRFPEGPILLYLFNPFPDYVLESVMRNFELSLCARPRPAFVIYNTPMELHVFETFAYLEEIHERENFRIYRSTIG
ncbi:MAG TPA: class I SAM-dependent methyltransferase, partial [Terriglobales bacterium]|nr:class I SAM-dependent methyltransferase [Terriglobales bacterium]